MLMPKRVKRRKQFRGSMRGKALRGNTISYGDFGLVATEPCWIKSNQIEAARIAMTRYIKRGGKVWIKICLLYTSDFDKEKIVKIAQQAHELGIEMLVLDDGWFGKRDLSLIHIFSRRKAFPKSCFRSCRYFCFAVRRLAIVPCKNFRSGFRKQQS